ncbi:MAG TPA: hypothetical protein VLW54_10030 [Candidatus Acidoferrales bacterium]|nr:hypothetical protein [Candidatus Acidoferrales bacterium]
MRAALIPALVLCAGLAGTVRAQTVDEIIAKNVAARGGLEKMRAIHTMVVTASLETPGGTGPLMVRLERPGRIQEDLTLNGVQTIRTFNGTSAWVVTRKAGAEEVKELEGGDLQNLRDEGENGIDGALADYKNKGNQVEFAGAAVVDGKTCYKLKVTLRSGHVQYQFLDSTTYLEIHEEIERTFNGNQMVIVESVGDYREEGGVLFAHKYVSGVAGRPQRSTLRYEKVEVNPRLEKSLFEKPKGAARSEEMAQPAFVSAGAPALPGKKFCASRRA